ncbi:MAG: hypothetical protein HZA54_14495 [Planctomycetes bacterium]|nr:hypothetical protein [Planctomycetota bacterium]
MKCRRCGFHNLPGTATCVACRMPLGRGAGGAARGVRLLPPRAPRWRKALDGALEGARRPLAALGMTRQVGTGGFGRARALWGLAPGVPQFVRGERRRAAWCAGLWAAALLVATWLYGSGFGAAALGAALSVHVISALLPYGEELARLTRGRRAVVALAALGALLAIEYVPLTRAVGRVVVAVEIFGALEGPLQTGDVVLVWRRDPGTWRPAPGTLVAATLPAWSGAVAIDRVLAGPGDHLTIAGGVLLRNGAAVAVGEGPLVAGRLPRRLDLIVPAEHVFMWPSAGVRVYDPVPTEQVAALGLRARAELLGEAWRIAAPIGRRGPIGRR